MPKMPVYNSQRSLTTDMPAPIKEGSAQEATAMSPIVDAASQIHQKWNEAVDTMQYTSAKASFETGIMDILNRASQDPDYNGSDKYFKEIETLKRNTTKGISNKQLEQQIGAEFGVSAYQAKLKIDNVFRKKQLDFSQGELLRSIDVLEQQRLTASTRQEAQNIDNNINTLIELNVKSGVITPEQGYRKQKEARINAVDFAIASNPEFALEELKNKEGLFKDVPADVKVDKINLAEKKIKQLYNDERDERQTAALDLAISGMLTRDFIENESKIPYEKGGLKPSTIRDLKRAFNRQQEAALNIIIEEKPDAQKFIDLVDKTVVDKIDARKTKDYLISAYADKVLTKEEAGHIDKLTKIMEQMQVNHNLASNDVSKAKKMLLSWTNRNRLPKEKLAENLKQLLLTLESPDDAVNKAKEIIKNNVLEINPDIANLSEKGELIVDADGNKSLGYPDGRIEDAE